MIWWLWRLNINEYLIHLAAVLITLALIILVYIDAILDIIRGKEGNPLWIPIIERFGMNIVLFLAIFVILLFYFAVKIISPIVTKIDKTPYAKEILLTTRKG